MRLKQQGFTLIELVIVIIILSILGIATSSYIGKGVSIYSDISERDRELNSVRFAMERLRRDVLNALPNSLIVSSIIPGKANVGRCLELTPIIASTLYGNGFPIDPISASSAAITTITPFDNNVIATDDLAVVYLLNSNELNPAAGSSPRKVHAVNGVNNNILTFKDNLDVSFTLGSPSKRLYFIRDTLTYCFIGSNLYRTQSDKPDDDVLMAKDITGEFIVLDPTLQRNGLAKVTFMLDFDEQEVPIEQTLHVNNVP